jgi:cell division protein FtsB
MASASRSARSPAARIVWWLVIVAAIAFAVQGGEYSTVDLVRQRRQREQLMRGIDSVRWVVDSLRRYRDGVERDPRIQERIAREEFGMVRGDKELLYRFVKPSSDSDDAASRAPVKR